MMSSGIVVESCLVAVEDYLEFVGLTQKARCIQTLQVLIVGHHMPSNAQTGRAFGSRKEAKNTALRFFCLCISLVSSSTFLQAAVPESTAQCARNITRTVALWSHLTSTV